jgi:hypothetical protein
MLGKMRSPFMNKSFLVGIIAAVFAVGFRGAETRGTLPVIIQCGHRPSRFSSQIESVNTSVDAGVLCLERLATMQTGLFK